MSSVISTEDAMKIMADTPYIYTTSSNQSPLLGTLEKR